MAGSGALVMWDRRTAFAELRPHPPTVAASFRVFRTDGTRHRGCFVCFSFSTRPTVVSLIYQLLKKSIITTPSILNNGRCLFRHNRARMDESAKCNSPLRRHQQNQTGVNQAPARYPELESRSVYLGAPFELTTLHQKETRGEHEAR